MAIDWEAVWVMAGDGDRDHISHSWRKILAGVRIQSNVVLALMKRDALGRYGHANLGFFWIIGEPLVFTTGIMILWSLAHISHGEGVSPIPFALTGYSFITMWRHITARAMGILRANSSILYFRRIKNIDVMIAIALLEVIACFSAFCVAYLPLWCFDLVPTLNDPLALVGGYALTGIFAFGFGLFLAGFSQLNEVLHHITPALMYMSMPLTGIFAMVDWLPERVQKILLWSPLVNGSEMFRSGLFPPEVVTHWSVQYLAISGILTTIFGYAVFSYAEKRGHE